MKHPTSKRTAIPEKIKRKLQQEIGSVCPFCDDDDVSHFDCHHIDENRSNSIFENLLMCCKICHSRITNREISREEVIAKKKILPNIKIQLVSVKIDSNHCSWLPFADVPNAFYNNHSKKSPFPLFTFSFINHYKKTILLTAIHLRAEPLQRTISGLPRPQILRPTTKYRLPVSYIPNGKMHLLDNQLEIPPECAFQFQVQLYVEGTNEILTLEHMDILYFSFHFGSQNPPVKAMPILINCPTENIGFSMCYLG